jgi:uncharacterized protein
VDLDLDPTPLAVCRLPAHAAVPPWIDDAGGPLRSATRTRDELSIVVAEQAVPAEVQAERGWRALRVRGPLAFSLTGVLASLAGPLADAEVPIFVLSTYDTDWVLVPDGRLNAAVAALTSAGHHVHPGGD